MAYKLITKCTIAAGVFLSLWTVGANQAQAVVLVNGSTQGYYNSSLGDLYPGNPADPRAAYFRGPNVSTGDPTLSFPTAPDLTGVTRLGSWLSNPTTAVTNGFWTGLQAIPATWAVNSETAIIYEVDGGSNGVSNLIGNFGVDNGIFVWVNGQYKFGATAPGGAFAFEYPNINLGSLNPGKNFIQILRADHGGGTGFVTSITGDYIPKPVPEPTTTLSVLLLGAFGVGSTLKRKQEQKI
ncbi:MAG TPA: PEP-CTERM sorting domain-containing protein [Nostocaceae cyanobacterium]|nr:PEP-CTERM sorting domain-containing protein [Nostocaceae cyanobacterium]